MLRAKLNYHIKGRKLILLLDIQLDCFEFYQRKEEKKSLKKVCRQRKKLSHYFENMCKLF